MSSLTHLLPCLVLAILHTTNVRSDHAMTTVLARPLGGYGLSPLIFEPSINLLGLGSDSIETKVRKSPVFELIMPNYDDEISSSLPELQMSSSRKSGKKMDYESLISKSSQDKSPSPSTNSYFSASNMLDLFRTDKSGSMYDEPMPSYKEQIDRSDYGKASKEHHYNQQQQPQQQHQYSGPTGPVNAAVQSIRSVEVKNVQDSYENNEPQVIDIPPSALPIVINFRTSSSQIQIHQTHEKSEPAEVQQTQSEDQPQYLKHMVTKPVIQEVHEVIMPYRKIIQEILPVEETIKTVVARGTKDRSNKGKNLSHGQGKYNSNSNSNNNNNNNNNLAYAAATNGAKKTTLGGGAEYKS